MLKTIAAILFVMGIVCLIYGYSIASNVNTIRRTDIIAAGGRHVDAGASAMMDTADAMQTTQQSDLASHCMVMGFVFLLPAVGAALLGRR